MCQDLHVRVVCHSAQTWMAAIPRAQFCNHAQFFNHVVDTDIYIVNWQGKKRRIQAIMDEFTRFEAEARIKRETVQCEIKGFEKLWLGWAGTPIVLRCDMSGAHMSDEFASWCDGHGIKTQVGSQSSSQVGHPGAKSRRASESAVNLHVGRSEPSAECERVFSHSACFGFSTSYSRHLV